MRRQGIQFLDIIDLKYDPGTMSPTAFYGTLRDHFVDNLRKAGDVVAWKSANPISEDEEMSYLLEDTILLMTISLIDQRLLPHIREVYRHHLGVNTCLGDLKSDILNSTVKMINDIDNKEDIVNTLTQNETLNHEQDYSMKVDQDYDTALGSGVSVGPSTTIMEEKTLIKIEAEEVTDPTVETNTNKDYVERSKSDIQDVFSIKIVEEFSITEDALQSQAKGKCEECNKFFNKKSLIKHMRNIHGQNRNNNVKNMCKKCGAGFETYREKCRHVKVVHRGIVIRPRLTGKEVQEIQRTGNRVCIKCGVEFPYITDADKAHFKRHTRNNIGKNLTADCKGIERQKMQLCNCKKSFKSKAAKSRHIKIEHLGYISCPKCSNCIQADSLEAHVQTHDSSFVGKDYVCEHCGKTLKNVTRLRYHKQNYHPKSPSICEVCQQSFPNKYRLERHREDIHQENAQCEMCAKTFLCRRKLLKHLKLVHTEEEDKQHQCDQCEKKFVQEGRLRNHQVNVHLKTRPFDCRYKCGGMAYNDSSNRNSHEKRKHGAVFSKRLEISPSEEVNVDLPFIGE